MGIKFGSRLGAVPAVVVLVLIAGCTSFLGGPAAIESTFDENAESWTVSGDAQGGSVEPTHHASGGVDGGYLSSTDDVTGGVWYWSAPSAYLGEKGDYYGGRLAFSLNQSSTSNQFEAVDVVLESGDRQIGYRFDTDDYPGTDWTDYEVPLTESGWIDTETGDPVTREDFEAVLGDLDGLFVRGEYRTGGDVGGLGGVRLSPE